MATNQRKRGKLPRDHDPAAVKRARELAGLTKTQVARALEVSVSLISEIESGSRNATPANLNRLSEVLGCPRALLERKQDQLEGGE
ncbi:helix-turn-helix transcriptional regulator [Nocardiopsis sp. NPDC006139]|jgi:transcriptional regulator with XRE-family HTH domain|uniref:helix-turn-helix domain-containing protein n=1 Tax=Nocardiopsis sp. NPDC006139 TaxID=3154578 RepID=UPI0033A5079B